VIILNNRDKTPVIVVRKKQYIHFPHVSAMRFYSAPFNKIYVFLHKIICKSQSFL